MVYVLLVPSNIDHEGKVINSVIMTALIYQKYSSIDVRDICSRIYDMENIRARNILMQYTAHTKLL